MDNEIQKIAKIMEGKTLMELRNELEELFHKKNIDFLLSPIAHFRIKSNGKTILICNKKYAENPSTIVGELAIGYNGEM